MSRSLPPRGVLVLLCSLFLGAPAAPTRGADGPKPAPSPSPVAQPEAQPTFANVLARIRRAAERQDWQKPEWRDPAIEAWLEQLVAAARDATKRDSVKLPVDFAKLKNRGQQPRGPGRMQDALVVAAGNLEVGFAERSVFLVDGNASVSFAMDCVIVARGAAYVAHGRRNVIVAGHFIHVSHDGEPRGRDPRAPNPAAAADSASLLISGSALDVAHAHGSVICAPESVEISHANGCAFINCPKPKLSHHKDTLEATSEKIKVERPPAPPLAGQLKLKWLVRRKGVVFTLHDRRYVAEVGAEIVDEAGKPVADLEGWKLSFADENYVLFTKGVEDFGLPVPPQ